MVESDNTLVLIGWFLIISGIGFLFLLMIRKAYLHILIENSYNLSPQTSFGNMLKLVGQHYGMENVIPFFAVAFKRYNTSSESLKEDSASKIILMRKANTLLLLMYVEIFWLIIIFIVFNNIDWLYSL